MRFASRGGDHDQRRALDVVSREETQKTAPQVQREGALRGATRDFQLTNIRVNGPARKLIWELRSCTSRRLTRLNRQQRYSSSTPLIARATGGIRPGGSCWSASSASARAEGGRDGTWCACSSWVSTSPSNSDGPNDERTFCGFLHRSGRGQSGTWQRVLGQ